MARRIAVEIVGDSASLEKAFKHSAASAQKFNKDIDKAGKSGKRLDSLKSSAAGMAAGFIGVSAVTGGIKTSIQAASDLGEQMSKTQAVFKDSSGEILDWSKTTASALGTSREQALEAAGTFGNMLVPMGFARGKAADMSRSMVNLAADLSSFNNASPEDTLEALRAGLAGESEPLRKFGIFLNDARLKQEAMRLGLYKGKGALDANAKAQATYALILKDSKDAQGDFARTSGSLANQQRIFSAQIGDLAAKLGAILLPQLTAAANAVTDWLSKTQNQKTVMDAAKAAVDAFSTALGILKTAFQVLSKAVGGNRNAITLLIAAYAGFKVLQFASKISTLAGTFGVLTRKQKGATGAAKNLRGSLAGKAGVAGAVVAAGFALSELIRQIPGWDNAMRSFGGTVYNLASNLGLVNDQMKQFEGKAAPSQQLIGQLRRQARQLERGGLTPRQAADRIAAQRPGVARHDIDVAAGVTSAITINGGLHLNGIQNPRQMEDALHKRAKRRPRSRR